MQNNNDIAENFGKIRKLLILLVSMAVVQMILIAPVYNRQAEDLYWASRTDTCFGNDYTFEWYSYRYCLVLNGDTHCFDYPDDDELSDTILAEASRAYPACMALATVAMFLSLVLAGIAGYVLLASKSDDVHAARKLSMLGWLAAGFNIFLVINSICIASLAGGGEAQTSENDLFGFRGCGSGTRPDESELGYGGAVHVVLVFWFIFKAVASGALVTYAWALVRRMQVARNSQPTTVATASPAPREPAIAYAREVISSDSIEVEIVKARAIS